MRSPTASACKPIGVSSAPTRPLAAIEHPGEHSQVLAEARPEELAGRILPEPVDVEDARRMLELGADVEPVRPVIAEVVAAERLHRHRVASHDADLAGGGRGGLGSHRGAHQHTVRPVARLVHQRRELAPPAAEDQCRDRHAARVLGSRRVDRVLGGGDREARVRVRRGSVLRIVRAAEPVDHRLALGATFPPGLVVGRERDVGEDRVVRMVS